MINRLVWQETASDIATGQSRGGNDSAIGDADTVIQLIPFLQATQNRDGVFNGRLSNKDGLESNHQNAAA